MVAFMGMRKAHRGDSTIVMKIPGNRYAVGYGLPPSTRRSSNLARLQGEGFEQVPPWDQGFPNGMVDYDRIDDVLQDHPDTVVTREGRRVPCRFVRLTMRPDSTDTRPDTVDAWIDPVEAIVRKVVELDSLAVWSFTVDRIVLDDRVDENVFWFTPPPGARRADDGSELTASRILRGRHAPGFHARTLDGRDISPADFRGRVVVLDFWATWCLPCRQILPELDRPHREYARDGLVVVTLSKEPLETVRRFMAGKGYAFTTAVDSTGTALHAYGVGALPTGFIIDREGTVRGQYTGRVSSFTMRRLLRRVGIGSTEAQAGH